MKIDNKGICYYDENDKGQEIFFNLGRNLKIKSKFFEVINNPNIIIKCPNEFNIEKELELLERFIKLKDIITKTELPTSYFKDNNIICGTGVPYYSDAPALFTLSVDKDKDLIRDYFMRDDDRIRNMFILYNLILDLMEELFENNICYFDSNSTNYVLKDNNVYLIDFDYRRIKFDRNKADLYQVLIGLDDLFDKMNSRFFRFDEFPYFPRSFDGFRKHLVKIENKIRKRG